MNFSRINHLKPFLKDSNKKSVLKIIFEVLHYGWIKKEAPTDYLRKFLYRKDAENYRNHLSLKEFYSIITSPKMVFPEISKLFIDKYQFYLICKTNNLPTPEILSYNHSNQFFYNNESTTITKIEELLEWLKKIFETDSIDELFFKPKNGIGGYGCFILNKFNLKDEIESFSEILFKNSYIHQKCIKQHDEINKIHSKSINSLRIDTYLDAKGQSHVLSSVMRFGTGEHITDNTHTGGFYIAIDANSGKLKGIGRQDLVEGAGIFMRHPSTNFKLEGFEVPYFFEACELAKRANLCFPNRIVGWDVAITNDGPLLIEGNHNPSLHITDVAYGGYCKHPLIKEMLKEIKR
ncbi:sugar-transfer associated ATP-grasp domain-containing protein [Changchengzhania lutea]|uniref:sugar-transfer associated ATP-grasp domain-containing protein n=1 Tax=Changchengzhania lutea TaxID=2049305 RepID=UPI00115F0A1E|nr:sugar-transfer associated ATP-grasp domain-containing protein [Changchengzhania lutea]